MAAEIPVNPMKMTLTDIYSRLYDRYGELNWWPAETPYEVMVGAVLTQNTNWSNVEKAIRGFDGRLSPELVECISTPELIDIIRPSGFFNQKAVYLKALTRWFAGYGYDVERVKQREARALRAELLAVKGVGKETADSILLYAFGFPEFVVDAYTKRLLSRLNAPVKLEYDAIKAYFHAGIPEDTDLYNNFHALIVINAKEHCRKKPQCPGCPLEGDCEGDGSV